MLEVLFNNPLFLNATHLMYINIVYESDSIYEMCKT